MQPPRAAFAFVFAMLAFGASRADAQAIEAVPRDYAQQHTTNSIRARLVTMEWENLFENAVVDHSAVKLPDQGPWFLSQSDLKQPLNLIADLVDHRDPVFQYLWDSISSETRTTLAEERAKMGVPGYYKVGPGLPQLTADLNNLIQGKLIYDEKAFASVRQLVYLSGDTRKLLFRTAGTNLARLNRLLLEDAFPLDLQRRPKILFDSYATNYVCVDFVTKTVSVYDHDGSTTLSADLGPVLKDVSKRMISYRSPGTPAGVANVGIWDVVPQPGELLVHVMGRSVYSISLSTGKVSALAHF